MNNRSNIIFCVKFTWWVKWNLWYLGRSEIFSSFMLVFHPLLCRCPEEECGEEFHSKLGLTRHMLGHKKRDNLALTCPVDGCGKTFKWKSRYDVHLRSHNGGSMVEFCVMCCYNNWLVSLLVATFNDELTCFYFHYMLTFKNSFGGKTKTKFLRPDI